MEFLNLLCEILASFINFIFEKLRDVLVCVFLHWQLLIWADDCGLQILSLLALTCSTVSPSIASPVGITWRNWQRSDRTPSRIATTKSDDRECRAEGAVLTVTKRAGLHLEIRARQKNPYSSKQARRFQRVAIIRIKYDDLNEQDKRTKPRDRSGQAVSSSERNSLHRRAGAIQVLAVRCQRENI